MPSEARARTDEKVHYSECHCVVRLHVVKTALTGRN